MICEQFIQIFVQLHNDIRVAGIEGMNEAAQIDLYSDSDITFLTTDIEKYVTNNTWLDYFGERTIMHSTKSIELDFGYELYPYFIMFADGSYIDFKIGKVEAIHAYVKWNSTIQIVYDPDERMKKISKPTEASFHVVKPTRKCFAQCMNEFYWLCMNAMKGIRKKQHLYATKQLEEMRTQLLNMIYWSIGARYNYEIYLGQTEKCLQQYMEEDDWERLVESYRMHTLDDLSKSLLILMDFFENVSTPLCINLNYAHHDNSVKVKELIQTQMNELNSTA